MANSPENRNRFISQPREEVKGKTSRDPIKVRVPGEFIPPKSLVFREDASFLDPKDKGIMQCLIDGKSNDQIALRRKMANSTVKNRLAKVRKRLRDDGFVIPPESPRINIILALVDSGELELRDTE